MTTKPRILVYGGRNYDDRARLFGVLDHYRAETGGFAVMIEGEARGADTLARAWAEARGVPIEAYPAKWDDFETLPVVVRYRNDGTAYNAAAGGARNERMLREGRPDVGIEFPGGSGTADMRSRLLRAGVPVIKVPA